MTDAAGGWTKGPVFQGGARIGDAFIEINTKDDLTIAEVTGDQSTGVNSEDFSNAALIIEVFNVATETGLSPRQLAEQRAELIEALSESEKAVNAALAMVEHDYGPPNWNWLHEVRERARTLIDRTTRPAAKGEG